MRVLFLSQIVPYPPHGGVLQRGYNIIRQLGQLAEVHLLAFIHPDALPTPTTPTQSPLTPRASTSLGSQNRPTFR
jgi:hypothetical protein